MLSIALGQNRRYTILAISALDWFTIKVPFQIARADVHDAPQHLVTFATDICSRNLIIVPIFTSLGQNFPKSEDSYIARALHVHSAPQHPVSWANEKQSLNCISALNFASLAQSFLKVKVLIHMHSARALHVHHAPHHQMACTIELRSLNFISVPKLVSIAQSFLKPEDPYQINLFGPGARSLHLKGTLTTKACMLGKHTCNLQVWHQPRVPCGL